MLIQLCRQTSANPSNDSLQRGLVLLGAAFAYFSPSHKFAPHLQAYLQQHAHPLAHVAARRLHKRLALANLANAAQLAHARRPASTHELSLVLGAVERGSSGLFGEPLTRSLRGGRLPWVTSTHCKL